MRYRFSQQLSNLKDLQHIEWFVQHKDEYQFTSDKAKELFENIENNIQKKNIFYCQILEDYNQLVQMFENDPYEYAFDLDDGKSRYSCFSESLNHYFVEVVEEGKVYQVPYGYVVDNQSYYDLNTIKNKFHSKLEQIKSNTMNNFDRMKQLYGSYLSHGRIKERVESYKSSNIKETSYLVKEAILYLFYSVFTLIVVTESNYFLIIGHFWQMFSSNSEAKYSLANQFLVHKIFGFIIVLVITYFLFMFFLYTYGLYYQIYIRLKYRFIVSDFEQVQKYAKDIQEDYEVCSNGFSNNHIPDLNHRERIYVPFLKMINVRYKFTVKKIAFNHKRFKIVNVEENSIVPYSMYYSHPLWFHLILLVVLWVFVHALVRYRLFLHF